MLDESREGSIKSGENSGGGGESGGYGGMVGEGINP